MNEDKLEEVKKEIVEIVNKETQAWNTKDVDVLLSIFHSDMVWVWPKKNTLHNPVDWEMPMGKFDYKRWKDYYSEMFSEYELIRNNRKIVDIKITNEKDGAFAVVDVDTLWQDKDGKQMHWLGRAGKAYTKTNEGWKLISHFGLLVY